MVTKIPNTFEKVLIHRTMAIKEFILICRETVNCIYHTLSSASSTALLMNRHIIPRFENSCSGWYSFRSNNRIYTKLYALTCIVYKNKAPYSSNWDLRTSFISKINKIGLLSLHTDIFFLESVPHIYLPRKQEYQRYFNFTRYAIRNPSFYMNSFRALRRPVAPTANNQT